jgi:hypothetical protein
MFCNKFHAVTKRSQMDLNTTKCTDTLVWGLTWWIGCVRCKKSWHVFVARTFVIIALVHPVLHWVSCSYETIPNASKHYETDQNMSLGSNGVVQVHSLQKMTTWLHGTNFSINCTSSLCFASSFMQLQNNPKCIEIMWNRPKHEFRVQQDGLGAFVAKNQDVTSRHQLLH